MRGLAAAVPEVEGGGMRFLMSQDLSSAGEGVGVSANTTDGNNKKPRKDMISVFRVINVFSIKKWQQHDTALLSCS